MTHVVETAGTPLRVGRNEPCPCGSGLRTKRCHGSPYGPPPGALAIIGGASPRRLGAAHWTGQSRGDASLLVLLDAGAGDAIHAMRHVARAEAEEGPVTWVLRPSMCRLFGSSFPTSLMMTAHPLPHATYEAGSLDLIAMRSERRIVPYLRAPRPRRFQPGPLRVGLCARGDRTQVFDRWRSIHDESLLAPLLSLPGIEWHRLEPEAGFTDWADTANLVASLDLVVSVDTGVAHLAGALGRPLLLLNRSGGPGDPGPDDRWEGGWLQPGSLYPHAIVFQQEQRDRWEPVIEGVRQSLEGRLCLAA